MKKKFLALVMTLSMVLSLVPMTALATGDQSAAEPTQGTQADVQVGQKEPTASVAEEEPTQDEQKTEAQKTSASEFTVDGLTYEVQDDAESVKVIEWDKVAESVTIPVTVSNNGVTYKVSSLTTNNVKLFQNQKGLKSINIEAKVTTLANSMFYGCSGLTEVILPDTLEIVPRGAFQGCTNLTSITLPQNVKEVGASAFEKSGLQTIVIPSGVTKIQNSTFANCSNLQTISGLENVNSIGQKAFYQCTSLTEVTLPDTLEIVPIGAFQGCTNLTSITLPQNVKEIGASAFEKSGLETIVIPSGVTKIQKSTFASCSNLQTISGLENVNSIGQKAFFQCTSLNTIEGLHQLKTIDTQAFFQCADKGIGIKEIDIDWSKVESIGDGAFAIAFAKDAETITLDEKTFESLKKIGKLAFAKAQNMTGHLFIPEGVESIPDQAFMATNIVNITLPNSVKNIGSMAFALCTNLQRITIGSDNSSKLTNINSSAFMNDSKITSVIIHTSKDSIPGISDKTFPKNVTPTYTVPSINGEKDLQGIIDKATEESVIISLDENTRLTDTVTIPRNKTVTITTGNDSNVILLAKAKEDNFNGPIFEVEAGGTLILDGNVSYQGQWVGSGTFAEVNGTLTLKNGEILQFTSQTHNNGIVEVNGETNATFNMEGGTIRECSFLKEKSQYSGTVLLNGQNATMIMTGGTITENESADINSTPGVLVYNGASFTMKNGTISNNTGFRGAGVLVADFNNLPYNPDTSSKFVMSDGEITGNVAKDACGSEGTAPNPGGGGVFIQDNAEFLMTGGTISKNKSYSMGGGVATSNKDMNGGGKFTLNGGTISENSAVFGGGVYSYSKDTVLLEKGHIEKNKAGNAGGGIYVSTDPYNIKLNCTLITGNSASIMGGGVWSCPKGTVNLGSDSAVYGNTATTAGDDLAFLKKEPERESKSTFGIHQLGGGLVSWYKDNTLLSLYYAPYGGTPTNGTRYDTNNPGVPIGDVRESKEAFSLKAVVTQDSQELATRSAQVFIQNNTAARGGGIGSNGEVTISGESDGNMSVSVKKVWQGNDGNYPSTVTVNLVRVNSENENDKKTIGSVILSEANNWSYTFTSLDDNYTYTVTEDEVSGYRTSITKDTKPEVKTDRTEISPDNNVSFTITNTRKGGGSSGGGPITIPDDVPTGLDLKNHYGYIIGYPVDYYTGKPTTDQTKKPVRPEGKITRAEVATIYFRMLTDENRAANWNQVSGFSDVKSSAWYNNAISTLTKAGILKGYEDGTFQPNGYITRAEFATIAIRFFSGVYEGEDLFPDIKGHWAEDYINNAANKGLVKGYEDGTFGPDRYITRAEAVTLVNRTLNRHPHNDGLHQDMLRWPDNMDTSKWYYADMQEATNSHEPDKNKSTADKEYWGKMLPIRDWEALEKEWSNANSAPGEGEVV
ncbi:MAG: leucine-rich repeat protein [Evtepia sp.]|nr:leucine-rich repeat protein [Evtepia sp.]